MNIDKSPKIIKNMFDQISQNYDRMNRIISFGTDKIIKKKCIKLLNIAEKSIVLDLCTGTGDLVKIIKSFHPEVTITGVDFSKNMLNIAQKSIKNAKFINADVTSLPFDKDFFDIITISYGLRNIENRTQAIQEMFRVLKTGGKVLHLDFVEKTLPVKIFENITPIIAKFLHQNYKSYKYLAKSKQAFPTPAELIREFEKEGFQFKQRKDFIMKSISAQVFTK